MYRQKRVCVVVPAFNEEKHLHGVLEGIPPFVDDVVVVDDASVDGTSSIATSFGAPVRLIQHPVNRGVGASLVTGYQAALAGGADLVAVMAGDAQMCPLELDSLMDAVVEEHADYAKGDRLSHPEARRRMPWVRRRGSRALTYWTARVSGYDGLRDAQCGFTVATAEVLRRLPLTELTPRYGYPNDLLVMLGMAGARLAQPMVTPIYQDERSGLQPWKSVFTHSLILLKGWRRIRRRRSDGVAEERCVSAY